MEGNRGDRRNPGGRGGRGAGADPDADAVRDLWQSDHLGAVARPKSAISMIMMNLETVSPCCAFQKLQGTLFPSVLL